MEINQRSIAECASALIFLALLALVAPPAQAADGNVDVQRQLRSREQGQEELRLKMQQQADRSREPQSPSAERKMRDVERGEQQRLRDLHEREMRATIAPDASG